MEKEIQEYTIDKSMARTKTSSFDFDKLWPPNFELRLMGQFLILPDTRKNND